MGMAQGINGLDRNPDAGFSVVASEFVKLGLKAIGSSDAFAEICFQYIKTQNRENFAKQFSGDCRSGGQSLSLKSDAFALSSCKLPVVEKIICTMA